MPRPAAAADEDLAPFVHGVASGDPTPDAVILWTRISGIDGTAKVRWEIATDLELTKVVKSGTVATDASRDHTVKVDVGGLPAGVWLFYRFTDVATGRRSLVGRTRTAPDPTAAVPARFGVVSCSNYTGGYFNAYARLADRDDLDAVLHLGDYIYEYGNGTPGGGTGGDANGDRYGPESLRGKRDHVPADEAYRLADYRARYAGYRLDPDLRRLHQLFPWMTIWDDHEVCDNAWTGGGVDHQPDVEGDFQVRKDAGRQAYGEWMLVRTADPAKIYRRRTWGADIDLVFLDTRLEGRDEQVGTTGATVLDGSKIDDPNRHLISATQLTWLLGELDASKARGARWQVIAQQVILGQWNAGGLPALPATPDTPLPKPRSGGNALNPDQWDGYTAERKRLFDHLASAGIPNPVVLTGDVHSAWALDLTPDPYAPLTYNPVTGVGALGVELVTTSVTAATLGDAFGQGTPAVEQAVIAGNPHVKWINYADHGFFVLDLTPARARADYFTVDTVLAPSDTPAAHDAAWQTLAGSRHLSAAAGDAPTGPAIGDRPAAATVRAAVLGASTTAAPTAAPSSASTTGDRSLPATGGTVPLPLAGALVAAGLVAWAVKRRSIVALEDEDIEALTKR